MTEENELGKAFAAFTTGEPAKVLEALQEATKWTAASLWQEFTKLPLAEKKEYSWLAQDVIKAYARIADAKEEDMRVVSWRVVGITRYGDEKVLWEEAK